MMPAQILNQYPKVQKLFMEQLEYMAYNTFKDMPLEFQWGVWLKFFDRQGIVIEIEAGISPVCEFHPCIHCDLEIYRIPGRFDTREAAQLAALTAALTILEGRL